MNKKMMISIDELFGTASKSKSMKLPKLMQTKMKGARVPSLKAPMLKLPRG